MDKPEQFDSDGRDPEVVRFLKFHAERTGQSFCREDVPPALSIDEFWEEAERRGEMITAQSWLRWKHWLLDAGAGLRRYIVEREADRGPDDAFVRFMKATLPTAPIPSSPLTPTQRWAHEQQRKKKFMEVVSGKPDLPSSQRERTGSSDA